MNEGKWERRTKNHIVPLRSHVYVNPADPFYYEKILQYVDGSSPEALYHVGMKLIHQGAREKGTALLNRCAQTRTAYALRARSELERMQSERPAPLPASRTSSPPQRRSGWHWKLPAATAAVLLILLLLAEPNPVKSMLTRIVTPVAPLHVVYETSELPFFLYIDDEQSPKEIERLLYDEIRQISRQYPEQLVQIYGLPAGSGKGGGKPLPLRNPALKERAFVLAEYREKTGESVLIRFFPVGEPLRVSPKANPSLQISANLVRTALQQYAIDHGKLPERVQELLSDYPDNYLSFIPAEPASGSADISSEAGANGEGGWIYEPGAGDPALVFRPNGGDNVSYAPMEIIVAKSNHTLYVVNGPYLLAEKTIGLGKEDSTPEGSFRIDRRVLEPQGASPGVYGAAALGFGAWALHGTNAPASVGANESLGCVRLTNADVSELFPYVPLGAEVRIGSGEPEERDLWIEVQGEVPGLKGINGKQLSSQDERGGEIIFSWLY